MPHAKSAKGAKAFFFARAHLRTPVPCEFGKSDMERDTAFDRSGACESGVALRLPPHSKMPGRNLMREFRCTFVADFA